MESNICHNCGGKNVFIWNGEPYCWDCQEEVTMSHSRNKENEKALPLGSKLVLRVSDPKEVEGDWFVTAAVTLSRKNNMPLEQKGVYFFLDEKTHDTVETDNDGNASIKISGLDPGSHVISAQISGSTLRKDKRISVTKPKDPALKISLEHTVPITNKVNGLGSIALTVIVSCGGGDRNKIISENISIVLDGNMVAQASTDATGKINHTLLGLKSGPHTIAVHLERNPAIRSSTVITVDEPLRASDFDAKIMPRSREEEDNGRAIFAIRMFDKNRDPCGGICVLTSDEKDAEKSKDNIVVPPSGYATYSVQFAHRTKFYLESPPLERIEEFDLFGPETVHVHKNAKPIGRILLGISLIVTISYFGYFGVNAAFMGYTSEDEVAMQEYQERMRDYNERLQEYNAYMAWGEKDPTSQIIIQETRRLKGLPPIPEKPDKPNLATPGVPSIITVWNMLWILWVSTLLVWGYCAMGLLSRLFRWLRKKWYEDLEGDIPGREGGSGFWDYFSGGLAPLVEIFRSFWFFRRRR